MMIGAGVPAMQPKDDTVRMIWEGVLGADRMCRYY